MTNRVVITGSGLLSPLGDQPRGFHEALCAGRSGLKRIELFDTRTTGGGLGAEIADFSPESYLGDANFRPLDRTGLLCVVAAQAALRSCRWDGGEHVGLVLGTMFCGVRTIAEFDRNAITIGPKYAKPMDFANTVINAAAGQTAIWHKLSGVNSTISTGITSGLQAIGYAADLVRGGRAAALLAGGAEELCFESYLGFRRAGLAAGAGDDPSFSPFPFDRRRNGFAQGEGAAFLMLEDQAAAMDRGAWILGEVVGHAGGYDPSRGQDRAAAENALRQTVRRALDAAALNVAQIDAISASANGSPFLDAVEARVLAELFPGKPVTATKALTGESLGASGAFQAASLLETMHSGILPGVPDYEPDPDLPAIAVTRASRSVSIQNGLVLSLGFDGCCSALILRFPAGAADV